MCYNGNGERRSEAVQFKLKTFENVIRVTRIANIHYFEFTKESESQSEEMTEKNKDIYNVKCIYSLEYDKEIKFRDDNILIDGINGKRQGFLFFIEELCNEDYDED